MKLILTIDIKLLSIIKIQWLSIDKIVAAKSAIVGCNNWLVVHRAIVMATMQANIRYLDLKAVTKCSSGDSPVVLKELLEAASVLVIWVKNNLDRLVYSVVNEKVNCVWIREHVAIDSNSRSTREHHHRTHPRPEIEHHIHRRHSHCCSCCRCCPWCCCFCCCWTSCFE